MDSESPNAQRVPVRLPVLPVGAQAVPDGTLYQAPATFHTSVSHYCYPSPGIEVTLGDTPVVSCNRWNPMSQIGALEAGYGARLFMSEDAGKEYQRQLDAWEAARAQEAQDASEADSLIADSLIEAQIERYTFAIVAHDPPTGRMAVSCDAYPSAGWYTVGVPTPAAIAAVIEMHKDTIRSQLRGLYDRGERFPEPPIKESK